MTDFNNVLNRALKFSVGGAQTRSRGPGNVGPVEEFPLYSTSCEGARIFYHQEAWLDLFGANAAVPLGHAHPQVVEAVTAALRKGCSPSLPSVEEADTSEAFLRICAPWAQKVRWVKSGTEAVMAAVRMARAHTCRDRIVVMDSSYHGWSDLNDARYRLDGQENGVPADVAQLTSVMPYHCDSVAMHHMLCSQDVAAVVVEPHRWIRTDVRWLQCLRDMCTANGTVMVMDEMVYGLRWALGGASEYYGVTPDLACFGKALGNGVPVALVCGKEDVMQHSSYISGTYFGDTLGLSAAREVLRLVHETHYMDRLWASGRLVWHGFSDAMDDHCGGREHPVRLEGFPVHWRVCMADGTPVPSDIMAIAQQHAASQRVLFHKSSNNASVAMTADEAYEGGRVVGASFAFALGLSR